MTTQSPTMAEAFGSLSPSVRLLWEQDLIKNAQRPTMHELMDRARKAAAFDESIRRRNAMIRLFLARWGAIEAMRELRDPVPGPAQQSVTWARAGHAIDSHPSNRRRWRDRGGA